MARSIQLMTSQQIVASLFSDESVKVIFSEAGPKADLKNRIMYLRPIPDNLDEMDIETIRGDCDHELGHFMFTDVGVVDGINDPFTKLIFNAIEDGRVERLVSDRWYGCSINLARSGNRAISKILRACDKSVNSIRKKSLIALTLLSFGNSLDRVVKRLGEDISRYTNLIENEIEEFKYLENTSDALDLATSIVDKWSDWLDDGSTGSMLINNYYKKGLISCARKTTIKNKRVKKGSYVANTDNDKLTKLNAVISSDSCDSFFSDIKSVVPAMRRQMIMRYAYNTLRFSRHEKEGKLDNRSIYKYMLGSNRIFSKRSLESGINVDFTLLIDCSGSMIPIVDNGESRLEIASKCAAALCCTLDIIGITNECLAFTTVDDRPVKKMSIYNRVRPINHIIVKEHKKPYMQCRNNFYELAYNTKAYENIDGEAVLWAAHRSVRRSDMSGARSVIIVLSDGMPQSYPEKDSVLSSHLSDVISRVESAGAYLIGVGIDSDHVKDYYSNHLVCRDMTEFSAIFFDVCERLIRRAS